MKKSLLILCAIIFALAGCERPATITNWSPINDISTPAITSSPAVFTGKLLPTLTATIKPLQTATPLPTLDVSKFPDPLPKSLKGYELYSWQVGEKWNFTLITGTNRQKSFDELMTPDSSVSEDGFVKITVSGVDAIKPVLAILPAKSEVFWSGMDLSGLVPEGTVYFAYPDKIIKDDLINFCAEKKVKLEILVDPGQ